jgi:hypothetical protein
MLLITCPVTRTDELVADRRIRSVDNHPTHIALTVECPCGGVHVYRTGRHWEAAHARVAGDRTSVAGPATSVAGPATSGSRCRAARVGVPV